ncbi:hypothetical protein WA1_33340 [Scytonema hofmannii PCC 7110]|uniref:DUF4365 domain-containing protein n=1 Tax=Scytonema hofmannii PCC 7110 TaxID=128403 RepID=A0A139X2G7_9CYAN|nr:hypothetical protein [Scytonema hofmannii]KYC38899.1 hypothetical protein WA1_33340 [Scytonema hofmannii PCC 7110]
MDINQHKEQFSNTYLQALTSVAGYSLYKPFVDDDSVDWGIAAKGGEGIVRCLRHCGYWLSLRGMLPTTNTTNITVTIFRTNQFTAIALQSIMLNISKGDKP